MRKHLSVFVSMFSNPIRLNGCTNFNETWYEGSSHLGLKHKQLLSDVVKGVFAAVFATQAGRLISDS